MNKAWFRKCIQHTDVHRKLLRSPCTSTSHPCSQSGIAAGQKRPGRARGQGPPLPSPACGHTPLACRSLAARAGGASRGERAGNVLSTNWGTWAPLCRCRYSGCRCMQAGDLSPRRWNKRPLHVTCLSQASSAGISGAGWMCSDNVLLPFDTGKNILVFCCFFCLPFRCCMEVSDLYLWE